MSAAPPWGNSAPTVPQREATVTTTTIPINEAASRLGVGASTLRTWGEKLGVAGTRTSSGKRVYSDEDLAVLEAVKNLRDQDAGWQTIRRHIGEPTAGHGEPEAAHGAPTVAEDQGDGAPTVGRESARNEWTDTADLAEALVPRLVEALTAQNDLGERYAKATYQIGKLESDNEHLRAQLERVHLELAESRQLAAQLQAPPATSPRPWWKLWR